MITDLLSWISSILVEIISRSGYLGVTISMALESACIPIPSEIVMPFSGYLVSLGRFSLWSVTVWATIGNLAGSLMAYFIGYYGGRPLVLKYGRYILINHDELNRADHWFSKYGPLTIFFSRMLPVIRTFISLPAGIARMNLPKFMIYTFLGSLPWNFGLTYLGMILGNQWKDLEDYFRKFDYLILIILVSIIVWFVKSHLTRKTISIQP
jgi:membrane protein DedA with SNARE-associated domain